MGLQDDPLFAPLYRNLGLAYWNQERDSTKVGYAYERAAELAPNEHDQLRKKLGDSPDTRLARLENKLVRGHPQPRRFLRPIFVST